MDKVARAEAPVSPRGSPPRLLDLRRGRGLVIVTGGPPCASNAPLGGLNGGKGSILQLPRMSRYQAGRVNSRKNGKERPGNKPKIQFITAGARGASARRLECGGRPPTTNLGASPCRPLPTQFHMFHPVTSVKESYFI
jgi:hypothetical protein